LWRQWGTADGANGGRSNRNQERKARPPEIRLSDIGRYEKFDGIWLLLLRELRYQGTRAKTLIRPGYFRVNDAIKIDGEVKRGRRALVFFNLIKWTEHISTKRQLKPERTEKKQD